MMDTMQLDASTQGIVHSLRYKIQQSFYPIFSTDLVYLDAIHGRFKEIQGYISMDVILRLAT